MSSIIDTNTQSNSVVTQHGPAMTNLLLYYYSTHKGLPVLIRSQHNTHTHIIDHVPYLRRISSCLAWRSARLDGVRKQHIKSQEHKEQ